MPLAINTEQQSISLDVKLEFPKWHYLGSTFLPQCIVLKSLRIRNKGALFLLSKVKSIKADEISIDIDIYTDTNSLRSLLSRVLTNDMKIVVSVCRHHLHQPTLEVIFDSLSPPYLKLIAEYSGGVLHQYGLILGRDVEPSN